MVPQLHQSIIPSQQQQQLQQQQYQQQQLQQQQQQQQQQPQIVLTQKCSEFQKIAVTTAAQLVFQAYQKLFQQGMEANQFKQQQQNITTTVANMTATAASSYFQYLDIEENQQQVNRDSLTGENLQFIQHLQQIWQSELQKDAENALARTGEYLGNYIASAYCQQFGTVQQQQQQSYMQLYQTAMQQQQEQLLLQNQQRERMQANNEAEEQAAREKELQKVSKMSQEEKSRYEQGLLRKGWENVVRSVIRIYRYTQKEKIESEQSAKRFSLMCAKEVRKKAQRGQRFQKEFVLRAKKMHRDILFFWKKKDRELTEIKKRIEKLQLDLRKIEDQERETLMQKKRFEFIMRQSEIYIHFMMPKLGILQAGGVDASGAPVTQAQDSQAVQEQQEQYKALEIDEDKALKNVKNMINEQRETACRFDKEITGKQTKAAECTESELQELANQFDFSQVQEELNLINVPRIFQGSLKEYQLKGLRWLDSLYDQGINGILADEMGLGKTIEAIALLAHIAESKNNWGPFLVVAPASTLYNWQQEIKKFCPAFRVLPYWGSLKQRKTLRKYFQRRELGMKNSAFHVCVTSYQLTVIDEKTFLKMNWSYIILDEAQAIKNIKSERWSTLLSFKSRNKLLLTGTPIQNTMAELWALLHFIMPKLFDSHEHFQEWFSKDIEAHSLDQKTLNQHQLQRLHMILKPFMLRRIKKDVEHEIGQKKEFMLKCELTNRQRILYNNIKKKISIKDFFKMLESKAKVESLMNLVMQFRKVCNHPELFERRPCRSPFTFQSFYYYTGNIPIALNAIRDITINAQNPISFVIPRFVYEKFIEKGERKSNYLLKRFCIYDPAIIYAEQQQQQQQQGGGGGAFSFLKFIDMPLNLLFLLFTTDQFYTQVLLLHWFERQKRIRKVFKFSDLAEQTQRKQMFWVNRSFFEECEDYQVNYQLNLEQEFIFMDKKTKTMKTKFVENYFQFFPIIHKPKSVNQMHRFLIPYNRNKLFVYIVNVHAPIPQFTCKSLRFIRQRNESYQMNLFKKLFFPSMAQNNNQHFALQTRIPACGQQFLNTEVKTLLNYSLLPKEYFENQSKIEIPDFSSLIADSTKLKILDQMLTKLKKEGSKALIFCQMTRMIDILEEYMIRRQYKYFRLDGSCNIADRRDMVSEFQQNPSIFVFLLSTRAGGLGVTLTAANTVIFYDNDWNPTMDAQATDRAHRIGQTKEVRVYRLVCKSTIEENIVKRAQQKQTVQTTVYGGGAFKGDLFKPQEVMELLFSEDEIQQTQETKKFIHMSMAVKKKNKQKEKNNNNSNNYNGGINASAVNKKKKENNNNRNNNGQRKDEMLDEIEEEQQQQEVPAGMVDFSQFQDDEQ